MDKETNFDFDNLLTDSGSLEGLFGESGDSMERLDAQSPFASPDDSNDGFSSLSDDWLQWDGAPKEAEVDSLVAHTPPQEAVQPSEPMSMPPQEAAQPSAPEPQPLEETEQPLPVEAEPETEWEDDFGEDTAENPFDDSFSNLSDDWPDDWSAEPSKDDGGMPFDGAPLWESASEATQGSRTQKANGAGKGKGISPATAKIVVPFAAFVIVMTVVCAVLFIKNDGWKNDNTDAPVTFSDKAYIPPKQDDTLSTTEPTDPETTTEEPTTTTAAATEYKPLKPGDKNQDVLNMQNRLLKLGYIGENSCTGYYGGYTQKRLAVFQRKAGLEPTGIADAVTLERLYADDAPKCA